jgi:hypothetical protein
MKTTITTHIKNTTKLFILLAVSCNPLISQNQVKSPYLFGISVGSHVSGNAHGTMFDGSVSLYNGKNAFSAGACVQKRTMQVCGGSFNYTRILTGAENFSERSLRYGVDDSKLQLFCYSTVSYFQNAALSYNAVKCEEALMKNQSEFPSNANAIKLSTAEISAGFGLNVKLSKQLVWSNYIGVGSYYHVNYTAGMYCEKAAPMLTLGTSLKLNYFTR